MTALAWHPEKEGLLAFGTDEGRIGTVDALHSRYVQRATKGYTGLVGDSDTLGTWGKCHCNQLSL